MCNVISPCPEGVLTQSSSVHNCPLARGETKVSIRMSTHEEGPGWLTWPLCRELARKVPRTHQATRRNENRLATPEGGLVLWTESCQPKSDKRFFGRTRTTKRFQMNQHLQPLAIGNCQPSVHIAIGFTTLVLHIPKMSSYTLFSAFPK